MDDTTTDEVAFVDWPTDADPSVIRACRTPIGEYRYQGRVCQYCGAQPGKIADFCANGGPGPEWLWEKQTKAALTE